jgi:hypothetical protein
MNLICRTGNISGSTDFYVTRSKLNSPGSSSYSIHFASRALFSLPLTQLLIALYYISVYWNTIVTLLRGCILFHMKEPIMLMNKIIHLSVGADLSRPSPIYRPSVAFHNIPFILLNSIVGPRGR